MSHCWFRRHRYFPLWRGCCGSQELPAWSSALRKGNGHLHAGNPRPSCFGMLTMLGKWSYVFPRMETKICQIDKRKVKIKAASRNHSYRRELSPSLSYTFKSLRSCKAQNLLWRTWSFITISTPIAMVRKLSWKMRKWMPLAWTYHLDHN